MSNLSLAVSSGDYLSSFKNPGEDEPLRGEKSKGPNYLIRTIFFVAEKLPAFNL